MWIIDRHFWYKTFSFIREKKIPDKQKKYNSNF